MQPLFAPAWRKVVETVVLFRRSLRVRAALQAYRATHAAAEQRLGQFVKFSETRCVGNGLSLLSFIARLPALRRMLLAISHSEERMAAPETVATKWCRTLSTTGWTRSLEVGDPARPPQQGYQLSELRGGGPRNGLHP